MILSLLNRYITIEKETDSVNAIGTPIETYATLKNTYATLKYTNGNTEFNEGAMPFTDCDFSVRYDSRINYKCRVKFPFENIEICPALATPLWTIGDGWSYGTSKLNKSAAGVGTATPVTLAITIGKTYLVKIYVGSLSGSTATWALGGVAGPNITASGIIEALITATSTGKLIITPVATALRMVIDAISIKEITYEYYKIINIELIGRKDGMRLKCIKWDANG